MNPNLYPRSGPDFYTLSNEEELNWLDCQINKVNEVSLSDELEERKLDALKLLQISFGRAPDTIHADVKEWGEGVRKSLNYLDDEAYEDEYNLYQKDATRQYQLMTMQLLNNYYSKPWKWSTWLMN